MFGVSPTQAALLPLTSWLFTAATLKEIYRKGGPINVHVDMPASQADNDIKRWLQQYMSNNIGPRNIGRPILTKGGAAVHELGMRQVQELLHTLDQKRDEIVAAFGVPPAEAGIIESGNLGGGTGESQRRSFIVNTCQPLAALVLEKLDYHLVQKGFGIKGWHLKFEEVDLRDSLVIEQIRDMRLRNGAYVLNKYRNEIGEPPVEGGDEPILVDRQNLVLWQDMPAASRATIAYKLKGTDVEIDKPHDLENPAGVQQKELPPGLIAGGAVLPGQPPPAMPPKPGAAPAKPVPAKPAAKKPAREDYPGRSVREDYRATYAERLRRALAEMPEGDSE
jgi:hypothetical protein